MSKAVADPAAYNRLYDESRPGSVLILDEAEKAVDARRGMTSESVDLSQSFAAKRYRQIISILTAPTKSWVDGRIGSDAADYWLLCQETDMGEAKGEAVVYRLGSNEFYENETKRRYETIEFPILDDHPEFQRLDEMKREKLEGRNEGETQYLSQSEVDEKIQSVKADEKSDYRNQLIRDLYETGKLTQTEIADAVGLAQSTVKKTQKSLNIDYSFMKALNNLYHARRDLENPIHILEHSLIALIELGERGDRRALRADHAECLCERELFD